MANSRKNYVISIKGGGKNREINLSSGMFKFGVTSAVIGSILFVGACGYSLYSALYKQKNADYRHSSCYNVEKGNEPHLLNSLEVPNRENCISHNHWQSTNKKLYIQQI